MIYVDKLNQAADTEIPQIVKEYEERLSKVKKDKMDEAELRCHYYQQKLIAHGLYMELSEQKYYSSLADELCSVVRSYDEKFQNKKFYESTTLPEYIKFNENFKSTLLERKIKILSDLINPLLSEFTPSSNEDKKFKNRVLESKENLSLATDEQMKNEALSILELKMSVLMHLVNNQKENAFAHPGQLRASP